MRAHPFVARSLSAAPADRDFLTGPHPGHGHHLTHSNGGGLREEPAGGSRNYAGPDNMTQAPPRTAAATTAASAASVYTIWT